MITRFDHAVMGFDDLAAARKLFEDELGFEVYPGGKHTGLGTENAIVRFGLDYLELIGIYSREEVAAAGIKRASLLDFLANRPGGMLGYCLATDDIDALAARFERTGLDALGPYAMERMRPDGVLLKWQLLVPGGTAWRRPWPFFIQWGMDDVERLAIEQPGQHRNGTTGVAGVSMVVHDIDAAQKLYSEQIGLSLDTDTPTAEQGAERLRYVVGDFWIEILAPNPDSPEGAFLREFDHGLYQVHLNSDGSELAANASVPNFSSDSAMGAELVLHS